MSEQKSGDFIGFTGLLLLTFIILKLTKVIDWSWWWVLTPFWVPLALAMVGAIVILIASKK